MPHIQAYLMFDGTCAEAMRFYERTLGGTLQMMTHAQSPMAGQTPPAHADRIMHASLQFERGGGLMASDTMPGEPSSAMNGFALSIGYPSPEEARKIFQALSAGGRVTMPMQKTFWSEAFGMLTDRYGTPWMVGGGEAEG